MATERDLDEMLSGTVGAGYRKEIAALRAERDALRAKLAAVKGDAFVATISRSFSRPPAPHPHTEEPVEP